MKRFGCRIPIISTIFYTLALVFAVGLVLAPGRLSAQNATAIAEGSYVRSGLVNGTRIQLVLSEIVPYKVRYLANPDRVIIEFDGLDAGDWPVDFGKFAFGVEAIAFGNTEGGARLVLHFPSPHRVNEIAIDKDKKLGFVLRAKIVRIAPADYAKLVTDLGYGGEQLPMGRVVAEGEARLPLIVLDAGHGGDDPGAIRSNIREKDVTLDAAERIKAFLLRSNRYRVAMTREGDVFVSLAERRRRAERLGADLFLSIHADTVEIGDPSGMTLYLLSKEASSVAAKKFAEFENRVDVFAGVLALQEESDLNVTLLDLAQKASLRRAQKFADLLNSEWQNLGNDESFVRIEHADFAVLKAPEFPSLLLEIGFLSNANDRQQLTDPAWLGAMAQSVLVAVDKYFGHADAP